MRQLSIERSINWILALACLVLLGIQLSSLYVSPVHDSYLWWGDESWLMNEYRSQMTTGVFRHPFAYGSSLWFGNPFPFTAMWLTSAVYGFATIITQALSLVNIGRTVTAVIALATIIVLWRKGRSLDLSGLSLFASIAFFISSRSFFLTSHSSRYDILTALALLIILYRLVRELQSNTSTHYLRLGILCGASLTVSAHVLLLLVIPAAHFMQARKAKLSDVLRSLLGAILSVGFLFVLHLLLQPSLTGQTNLSENLRTIPMMRPLSWSVQTSNLMQKWESILSFAPQIIILVVICILGSRSRSIARSYRQAIWICVLPTVSWLLLEPAGPTSYLVHILPALALGAMIAARSLLVGTWPRIAIGALALFSIGVGSRDALIARDVGESLSSEHRAAIGQILHGYPTAKIVVMNPAQSYLPNAPTTHFIELPNSQARRDEGDGYLLAYNSSIHPGFMWEVLPLRAEITSPELILIGRYLDVGRSYFEPLDNRPDTLFLQRLDLSGLYTRHID